MFHELAPHEFARAEPLFQGFDYSLSICAVLAGDSPGRIFVDDVERPRTALALTIEGYLLAGDDGNPTTNRSLRQLFQESIFTGQVVVDFDDYMALAVHPATWEAKLPELIPTHEAEKVPSYHYRCREVNFDWRAHLPEGYTVHRIDSTLLGRSDIAVSDTILKWAPIEKRWGTVENFTSKGLGFCVAYNGQAVSWCVADCASGDRMTVSIITLRAHRRRGLAAVAAAATVEYALSHGFSAAEWHCDYDNIGSWKTAEKVGFERQREYTYYYYIFDPIDQLAQLGERAFLSREYDKSAQHYDRAFALRENHPGYCYHFAAAARAALGDTKKAVRLLRAAVEHGWTDAERTRQVAEFGVLHGAAEWKTILARMENAAKRAI